MGLNPSIPLQVQVPQPSSPLETIAGIMQIRGQMAQMAYRQQEIEKMKAETQQRNRDLDSYNKVQQVLADPAKRERIVKQQDYTPIWEAGVSPNIGQDVIGKLQGLATTAQGLIKGKAEHHAAGRAILTTTIEGLDPKDDTRAATQWNGAIDILAQDHPELAQNLEKLTPGPNFRDQIKQIAGTNSVAHTILEHQAALEKEQAATAASKATAALHQAETPGAQAKAEREELTTSAMKAALQNPQSGAAAIDQAIPPRLDATVNTAYKSAWQAAMAAGDPQAAAHVVAAAAGHAAQIRMATSPEVRAGKAATARAEAEATAPVHQATAIATAKALRVGDNPAVAGVAPAAVAKVQADAIKLDQDYIGAKTAAEDIGAVLDMAEAGNKAAGANVPLMGVGAINAVNSIKRINQAEIHQYGTAGSLYDKIAGKLQGWTEGKPILTDVLNDMRELHRALGQGAYSKCTSGLKALNTRTGAAFQPTIDAPNIRAAPVAPTVHKVGDMVMYRGQQRKIKSINTATGQAVLE